MMGCSRLPGVLLPSYACLTPRRAILSPPSAANILHSKSPPYARHMLGVCRAYARHMLRFILCRLQVCLVVQNSLPLSLMDYRSLRPGRALLAQGLLQGPQAVR
jgi:hypothetical protein